MIALLLELLDHVHHFDLELLSLRMHWGWWHGRGAILGGLLGFAVGLAILHHWVAVLLLRHGVHHELIEHAWEVHHHFLLIVHVHSHCRHHHGVHHVHGRHLLLSRLVHLGGTSLFAHHGLDGLFAILAGFLWGDGIGQVYLLDILLLRSDSVLLGSICFDSRCDFRNDFHQDDLLAVGGQAVILLAESQEGRAVGFLHMSEIRCLIVAFVSGGLVDADDHPALKANSGLQLADGGGLDDSQVAEHGELGVELGSVNVHDWPG